MDFYYNRDYYMMRGHWEQSEPLVFALEQEDQNQQTMHQQATVEQPSTSEANIVDYAQHQHAPEQHEEQQFALPLNNPPPTQNTTNTTTTTTTPGCVATKQENYDSGVSPGTSPDRQSPSTNTSTAPNSRRSSVEEAANAVKQDNVVIKQEKIDYNDCNENNADIVEIIPEQLTCPVCAFTSENRLTFSEHLQIHCPKTSDSQKFTNSVMDQLSNGDAANNPEDDRYAESPVSNHEEHPEKEDAVKEPGLRVPRVNSQGKVKTFKCKQCNYVTITKIDFWEHTRVHIKPEKVLTCPKCPFITEYKHHLEYHIRNHVGSKPYTCNECSYTCVNKSMLNSHLKSHSAVYQFRCADCVYSTKYCHSLKLHLRKYRHNPAMVLNPDGTPNPYPIIDVYGTRRGPKPKPKKTNDTNNIGQPQPSTSNVPATVTSSTLANNIMSTMMTQAGPSTSTQATTVPTPTAVAPIINSFQFNPVMNGLKNMGNVNAFNTFNGAVNPNGMVLPAANGLVAGFPFFSGFPFTNPFRFNANNLNLPMGQHFMNNAAEPMMSSEFVNGNFNAEAANTSMTTETAEEAYDLRVVTPPNIRKIGEPEVTSAPLDLTKLQQNHQMTDNTQQINNVDHDFTHDNNTSSSIISNNNNDTITANNNFSNNIHEVMNLAQAAANPTNTPPKNMKNRRKGKAVKLENGFYQYNDSDENMQLESQDSPMQQCPVSPSPERIEVKTPTASPTSQAPLNSTTSATKTGKLSPENNEYHCTFCDLRFGNHVMYVVHMGLHDSIEPFKCNMCGTHCKDEVYFHLHMLEKPHY